MIRKIKVTDYPRLMEIWESAVLSTHDFLKEEDFLYYKERLPVYFQYVNLFGFEQEGILIGFMGIAEGNLEMLFIDNKYRGAGIGKKLITYAIDNLQVTKVDVNEQNVQAVGFYKYNQEATMIMFSQKTWDKILPEDQEIIQNIVNDICVKSASESDAINEEYMAKMEEEGLTVVRFSDEELEAFAKSSRENVWPQLAKNYPDGWLDKVAASLE